MIHNNLTNCFINLFDAYIIYLYFDRCNIYNDSNMMSFVIITKESMALEPRTLSSNKLRLSGKCQNGCRDGNIRMFLMTTYMYLKYN